MKLIIPVFAFCLTLPDNTPIQKTSNQVIQFNITKILNARPVTTLTDNRLVAWAKGIDGNGIGDGYLTQSAALFNGDKDAHALPDDPLFAASGSHPEIKLHYSNTDTLHMQACNISGEGEVGFSVPKGKYKAVFLALTSAEGPSSLKIQFNYMNGKEVRDFVLPDYYLDIKPDDPNLCYLAHDLAKWGNKNNMTEKDHHNIDVLKVLPNPARVLKSINIIKAKAGYLVFWGAAGTRID